MFIILANLPSQLVEFRRLASFLRNRGVVVRLLVDGDHLLSENGSERLPCHDMSGSPIRTKIAEFVSGSTFPRTVIAAKQAARTELQRSRPKCLIVGEDGVGGNLAWISVAKSMGIPVVVLPYEYSGVDQVIQAIRPCIQDYRVTGFAGRALTIVRPQWVRIVDGERTLRLPQRYALGYELTGVAPLNPWTVHGGRADTLLAESPQMVEHYNREGVNPAKVVLTGSLAFDDLHKALQRARPRAGALRILCAIPPDYTESRGPLPYAVLIMRWLKEARKHGAVTVQAHPSAQRRLEEIGVQYETRDIASLIAENDLLVTSVSSIIRYALAAGRPVLNFDCYKFNYPDYVSSRGCVTINTLEEFSARIAEMCSDHDAYRLRAEADAARWGSIDGEAGNRIATALGLNGQTPAQVS